MPGRVLRRSLSRSVDSLTCSGIWDAARVTISNTWSWSILIVRQRSVTDASLVMPLDVDVDECELTSKAPGRKTQTTLIASSSFAFCP